MIVKPCDQAEIDFYNSTIAHPEFKYYTPDFFGTLSLSSNTSAVQASQDQQLAIPDESQLLTPISSTNGLCPSPSQKVWVPSNGGKINTNLAIVLENVAAGFTKPNILDVKLGARLWADDAPPAKRQKLDKVASETTSKALGFRIAGMRIWMGREVNAPDINLDGYKVYDKAYGRTFSAENVQEGFDTFFVVESAGVTPELAREVSRRFYEDLKGLQLALEHEESRMYSASLLFIYEGDGKTLREKFEAELELEKQLEREPSPELEGSSSGALVVIEANKGAEDADDEDDDEDSEGGQIMPKVQALKLIDFAHAAWTPGQGPDENTLHGIRSVVKMLEHIGE